MTCGLLHVGKGFIDLQTVRLHIYILHRMSSSFYFEFVLTRRFIVFLSCICGHRRFIVFLSCICGHRRFIVFSILYMWLQKVYCVLYPVYVEIEGLLCSVSCICGYRRFIVFCILYMWLQKIIVFCILYIWLQKIIVFCILCLWCAERLYHIRNCVYCMLVMQQVQCILYPGCIVHENVMYPVCSVYKLSYILNIV